MTALANLLPCPFCGGVASALPPTAKQGDPIEKGGRFFPIVTCGGCWAEVLGKDHDKSCKSAIDNWNRRATLPPAELGGVEKRARELLAAEMRGHYPSTADRLIDLSISPERFPSSTAAAIRATAVALSTPRADEAVTEGMVGRAIKKYVELVSEEEEDYVHDETRAFMRKLLEAALSPAELGGVEAKDIEAQCLLAFSQEDGYGYNARHKYATFRDGFFAAFRAALSTPRADESRWLPTNGREPEGWRNHRLMFLCWEDGTVEASECYGSIAWEETTHWMPAKKPAKPSPPSPGAAK